MERFLTNLIKTYQYLTRVVIGSNNIFPLYKSECRFYPSCSDYALEAVNKYGATQGSIKSLVRVLKCNPLSKAGVDEP